MRPFTFPGFVPPLRQCGDVLFSLLTHKTPSVAFFRSVWVLLSLLALCTLSGCAQLVANQIEQANASVSVTSTTDTTATQAIYCSEAMSDCINYLYRPPTVTPASLQYTVALTADANQHRQKTLHLSADWQGLYRGTVVLIHGQGNNKRSWLPTMAYFNYLGLHTFAPDLIGHGDSQGARAYGVKDGILIADFIRQQLAGLPRPIIVVGHSIGALAAVKAATHTPSIDALALLAPMRRFDEATIPVARTYSPWLSRVISNATLKAGAELAALRAGVSLRQTDMLLDIPQLTIPILIYGAASDTISNLSMEQRWHQPNILRVLNENETHLSVVMVGEDEHHALARLLNQVAGTNN